jgi:hypothetical protein
VLFSGYCFARFDVTAAKSVLLCADVVAIVGAPGVPPGIAQNEIDRGRPLGCDSDELAPGSLLTGLRHG